MDTAIEMLGGHISELKAMAISGEDKDEIERECRLKGIEIASGYQARDNDLSRDVIALPSLNEVRIYAYEKGYCRFKKHF